MTNPQTYAARIRELKYTGPRDPLSDYDDGRATGYVHARDDAALIAAEADAEIERLKGAVQDALTNLESGRDGGRQMRRDTLIELLRAALVSKTDNTTQERR
jgi:hypothetical protein